MPFCPKCGNKLEDGQNFCPVCGASTDNGGNDRKDDRKTANNESKSDFSEKISGLNNTPDSTADFDQKDINDNKIMAIFAYLSWLVLVPLLAAKDSKFARFHTNQGLVLAIAEIIYGVLVAIINSVLAIIILAVPVLFFLSIIINVILSILGVIFLVLAIIGIINVANGKAKELPIIGKIKILK